MNGARWIANASLPDFSAARAELPLAAGENPSSLPLATKIHRRHTWHGRRRPSNQTYSRQPPKLHASAIVRRITNVSLPNFSATRAELPLAVNKNPSSLPLVVGENPSPTHLA
ncbi:hypothetical protein ACLOJK_036915 [Asimina triloba]